MLNLPIDFTVLIASGIALLTTILYIREYYLRKNAYNKQYEVAQETRQKSMQLLTAAEAAETQVLAEGKFATQKLEQEFKTKLENLLAGSGKSVIDAQNELVRFMQELKKKSEEAESLQKNQREQRTNELFERLETKLSDFLIQTEQKTTTSIELELKSTQELIETYKNAQLKLIDENIVAMMEQTLNIVLGKKLTLKDQLELVYEALERAKIDKFIV